MFSKGVFLISILYLIHNCYIGGTVSYVLNCNPNIADTLCEPMLATAASQPRHPGVCYNQSCLLPDEFALKIRIRIQYRPKRIQKDATDMWIRVRGPGFSWSTLLETRATGSIGVWTREIKNVLRSICNKSDCQPRQWNYEIRVSKDENVVDGDMIGASFFYHLPISSSKNYLPSDVVKLLPWFHGSRVALRKYTLKVPAQLLTDVSNTTEKATFSLQVIYPPSYEDNTSIQYALTLLIGIPNIHLLALSLEHSFIRERSLKEMIVVVLDHPNERNCSIMPYTMIASECKAGLCGTNCQTCQNPKRNKSCTADQFKEEQAKCSRQYLCGGKANSFIDFIENHVLPYLKVLLSNRIDTHHTIIGHQYGAVFASYLGIKKPELFSHIGSLTPLMVDSTLTETFLNTIQKNSEDFGTRLLYAAQSYYFDIGLKSSYQLPILESIKSIKIVSSALQKEFGVRKERIHFKKHHELPFISPPDTAELSLISRVLLTLKVFHSTESGLVKERLLSPLQIKKSPSQAEIHSYFERTASQTHEDTNEEPMSEASSSHMFAEKEKIRSSMLYPQSTEKECLKKHITIAIFLASIAAAATLSVLLTIVCHCSMAYLSLGREKSNTNDDEDLDGEDLDGEDLDGDDGDDADDADNVESQSDNESM